MEYHFFRVIRFITIPKEDHDYLLHDQHYTMIPKAKTPTLEDYKRNSILQLNQKQKLCYDFTTLSEDYTDLIYHILWRTLSRYQLTFLNSVLITVLRELINNAIKANLKSAYFDKKQLNLYNEHNHKDILLSFKEDVLQKRPFNTDLLKKLALKVKLQVEIKTDGIYFTVENNRTATRTEIERIHNYSKEASRYESLAEALNSSDRNDEDDIEGAGLGFIMSFILLKYIGLGHEHLKIYFKPRLTKASLFIPKTLKRSKLSQEICNKVMDELENIPTFSERVQEVITMCDAPDSHISQIAEALGRDPALTASLLRSANSAAFSMSSNRIDNIPQAISQIGLSNLKQLIMSHASFQILKTHYGFFENFIQHAERCALYARLIAQMTGNKNIADTVCLGGLLHDMGKIVLHAATPKLLKESHILPNHPSNAVITTLEDIHLGISHAVVGAKLAEKWCFTENIIQMIRYHHSPFETSRSYRKAVSIIYLANALLAVECSNYNYAHIDIETQIVLGLCSCHELVKLHKTIQDSR